MALHVSRASAVVVQKVPPALADWFLEWQRGITAAAEHSPGFRETYVYPPDDCQGTEWVVVMHFEDEKALNVWLHSPARAEWVDRLRSQIGDFELKALPGGFGPWFADLARRSAPIPDWKFALTVLCGLYPTVILLTLFPGPFTAPLGYPASLLIGQYCSCAILQWLVTPALVKVLGPWLTANAPDQRAFSIGGGLGLCAMLWTLAGLFTLLNIHP